MADNFDRLITSLDRLNGNIQSLTNATKSATGVGGTGASGGDAPKWMQSFGSSLMKGFAAWQVASVASENLFHYGISRPLRYQTADMMETRDQVGAARARAQLAEHPGSPWLRPFTKIAPGGGEALDSLNAMYAEAGGFNMASQGAGVMEASFKGIRTATQQLEMQNVSKAINTSTAYTPQQKAYLQARLGTQQHREQMRAMELVPAYIGVELDAEEEKLKTASSTEKVYINARIENLKKMGRAWEAPGAKRNREVYGYAVERAEKMAKKQFYEDTYGSYSVGEAGSWANIAGAPAQVLPDVDPIVTQLTLTNSTLDEILKALGHDPARE